MTAKKAEKFNEAEYDWLAFLPDAVVVLKDGNRCGRIEMDDVDVAFFTPDAGLDGLSVSDLQGIAAKMREMELTGAEQ